MLHLTQVHLPVIAIIVVTIIVIIIYLYATYTICDFEINLKKKKKAEMCQTNLMPQQTICFHYSHASLTAATLRYTLVTS